MTDSTDSKHIPEHVIAIVGMYLRVPGADGLDAFWDNLKSGKESVTFFSDKELAKNGVPAELLNHPDYVKASGRLDDIELFDAGFFDMTPREAEVLDPQHRILLEGVWRALEHAGVDPSRYPGRIGLYAGVGFNRYLINNILTNPSVVEQSGAWQLSISNDKDFAPTRVAYKLNLQGPAVAVNTACSTSLVATAMAASSLLNYQCDTAIAGGCSLNLPQDEGYIHTPGGTLSKDGHCRPFDKNGSGTIDGNGTACVVMKRYEDAIADGDTVYAMIRGFGINNDGSVKVGYTAPGVDGQADVILEALEMAQVAPQELGFIETHGTATELGDTVEIAALKQVFGDAGSSQGECYLGAVKSNIGHLDTAAGAAGLIKTVLSLSKQTIPPTCHFSQANPLLDLEKSPFRINNTALPWKTDGKTPRIAGVSSFGIGGTNAHVVLQEAPVRETYTSPDNQLLMFPVSAKSVPALAIYLENLGQFIRSNPNVALGDVAYTLQHGRSDFDVKVAVTGSNADRTAIATKLEQLSRQIKEIAGKSSQKDAQRIEIQQISTKIDGNPLPDAMKQLVSTWYSGNQVDWGTLQPTGRKVAIPGHPFIRSRYWIDPDPATQQTAPQSAISGDVLKNPDTDSWMYLPVWSPEIPSIKSESLQGSWLVLHDGSKESKALISGLVRRNPDVFYLDYDLFSADGSVVNDKNPVSGAKRVQLEHTNTGKPDWVRFFSSNPTLKPGHVIITGFKTTSTDQRDAYLGLFDRTIDLCYGLQKSFFSEEIEITVSGTLLLAQNQPSQTAQLSQVDKSVVLGPFKVLPQECPNFATKFIDTERTFNTDSLIATISGSASGSLVALRGGLALTQRFERIMPPIPVGAESRVRKNGTYLITGGLGDIGLTLARHLCETYDATVYLTTRNEFPAESSWEHPSPDTAVVRRRIARLREMRAAGHGVHIEKADVSDLKSMQSLVDRIETKHGRLDGVIHAAGIVGEDSFNTISDSVTEAGIRKNHAQFYPKTHGLDVLSQVLANKDFDFCMVCSSLSPILGGLGFATYAATNAWADSAVELLNAQQPGRWISVNWEGWMFDHDQVPGGNAGASAAELGINAEEGTTVFGTLMHLSPVSRIIVSSGDLNRRLQKWIEKSQATGSDEHAVARHPRPDYIGAYTAPTTPTQIRLTELWEQLLGISGIGIHDSFFELGGNSLLLTQLVSLIRKHFKSELTLARLFEQPTIDEMASDIDASNQNLNAEELEEGVI